MMQHGVGLLLLAAVGGYWVLERASNHKQGDLRRVGKALGWIIILVSVIGVMCDILCYATGRGMCFFPKKGGLCPISHSTPAVPDQSQ